jgi:hypothetical protein
VPIKLNFWFYPAEKAAGVLPIRAGGEFDNIEHGRHVAKHTAEAEHPDCDLVDIQTDDGAVSELWVLREGAWERDAET